jgi:beta-galactosidase
LNLDHRVSGVGGTAVSVLNEYQTFPQAFTWSVRLRPYRESVETLSELTHQRFW